MLASPEGQYSQEEHEFTEAKTGHAPQLEHDFVDLR
jgi:hypothetical protein